MKWQRFFLLCNLVISNAYATDCCICFDSISDSDSSLRLECGHTFHLCCIASWLKTNRSCPFCRVSTGTIEEEIRRYEERACERIKEEDEAEAWKQKFQERWALEYQKLQYEQLRREQQQLLQKLKLIELQVGRWKGK